MTHTTKKRESISKRKTETCKMPSKQVKALNSSKKCLQGQGATVIFRKMNPLPKNELKVISNINELYYIKDGGEIL